MQASNALEKLFWEMRLMKAKTKAETTTTWFRASAWGHITSVQVAKETDKMLLASVSPLYEQHWVGKQTSSGKYFPTFDAAREHAIARLKEQIEIATERLADLNQMLKEVPDSVDAGTRSQVGQRVQ